MNSLPSKQIAVLDATMHYVDTKENSERAVIFLHGNPTSSFLCRRIIPHVQDSARCLAPDLVGMGKSPKVNLVVHDWGSALGFHWANLNQGRVESISHMESLVAPFVWDQMEGHENGVKMFQALRSSQGEEMVLEHNEVAEVMLPMSIIRDLSEEEMKVYLEPYLEPGESRPENAVKFARSWYQYLSSSVDLPKLFIKSNPRALSSYAMKKMKDWPNQRGQREAFPPRGFPG
ncbi:unnamed protein product [Clavelina lepadiformis]|uniref:AB hydrolase-1 domain-containing protein n=1 Tax=Clavelina lepadiformis TaxID=159417 RepID=A0ABP0GGW6_CLALP